MGGDDFGRQKKEIGGLNFVRHCERLTFSRGVVALFPLSRKAIVAP
jgi:hypothetical protein